MQLGEADTALEATACAALDRRLDPIAAAPSALGLSGGGDSLALLLIATRWAERRGRPLIALTVDHGLSPDSAGWTAFAAEGAGRAGAEVLLLGHTLDDRREAELMRRRDAPTLGELREWSPSPAWPEGRGIFLLRPLLAVGRAELRAWLTRRGHTWIDDPANEDPRYARARARRLLAPSPLAGEEGAHAAGPLPLPQGERGWRCTPDGRITAPRSCIGRRFLSAALLCASGTDTPPRGERLERLAEALEGGGPVVASLAGARVSAQGDTVEIGREAGERARGGLAPVSLPPGAASVWDGRFEVAAEVEGLTVEALAGRVGSLSRPERQWLKTLPAPARSALPVLVSSGGAVTLPRPFGDGPATARCLVEARLAAACGEISREGQRPS